MKRHFFAALAVATLALASGASAQAETFAFTFNGEVTAWITDAPNCGRHGCDPYINLEWNGSLKVALDGYADGVYTGSDITSFVIQSNQLTQTFFPGDLYLVGIPSVTVQDGRVTEIDFNYIAPGGYRQLSITGQRIDTGAWSCGTTCERPNDEAEFFGGVALTPVPEPTEISLLLAGLAGLGITRRRYKAVTTT